MTYHAIIGGKAAGPFEIEELKRFAAQGEFDADSLVWKSGMNDWTEAGKLEELKEIFTAANPQN